MEGLKKLIDTMRYLRDPENGCPWDRQQDFKSLLPYFFEELHEYQEVVLSENPGSPHFQEELGDLLFQVVFHSQILEEQGLATLDSLAEKVASKLIFRHPHVFDENHQKFKTPEEVESIWEKRKQLSASQKQPYWKSLKKIPPSMGALARSQRIGEKAASLFGFDWQNPQQVLDKVAEELEEIHASPNETLAHEEFGDLLFALCQYARKRGWNAETAVAACNQKFIGRIKGMEDLAAKTGKDLSELEISDLEKLWQSTKV